MKAREWIARNEWPSGDVTFGPSDKHPNRDPRLTRTGLSRDQVESAFSVMDLIWPYELRPSNRAVDRDAEIAAYVKAHPEQ